MRFLPVSGYGQAPSEPSRRDVWLAVLSERVPDSLPPVLCFGFLGLWACCTVPFIKLSEAVGEFDEAWPAALGGFVLALGLGRAMLHPLIVQCRTEVDRRIRVFQITIESSSSGLES